MCRLESPKIYISFVVFDITKMCLFLKDHCIHKYLIHILVNTHAKTRGF